MANKILSDLIESIDDSGKNLVFVGVSKCKIAHMYELEDIDHIDEDLLNSEVKHYVMYDVGRNNVSLIVDL